MIALLSSYQTVTQAFAFKGKVMRSQRDISSIIPNLAIFTRAKTTRLSPSSPSGLYMADDFNFKEYRKGINEKMTKSIDSMQNQFNTIRAGQANAGMLDRIFVDYFGSPTPLNQLARVATSGSQQITIEPFDKSTAKEIEKAIATSDLNLTPTNDGQIIRINIPPLTEERRKELVKQSKALGEEGKVAIRNIRRDAVDGVKKQEKNMSKDESKEYQDQVQKLTDEFIKKLDTMMKNKESDLMKF